MAAQDVPYFSPPKFNPKFDDFRCFVFKVKEFCALYKLNIGMPRRHILIQGLPNCGIKHLLDHYGSENCHDQTKLNWATFDEIVTILEPFYLKQQKKKMNGSNSSEDEDEEEEEEQSNNDKDEK
uniref:Uncharacterized protein n=1 Tax=Panagrolaimus sp. ES5 TaxID=591445 RepID=A0AC34F3J3_9BILA